MLEKISKSLNKYSNYKEMKRNSPHFAQGVKDAKEGNIKIHSLAPKWITKLITQRKWDDYYNYNSTYCHLGKVGGQRDSEGNIRGGKVKIGFSIMGNSIPRECQESNDDELMQIDNYRRAYKIYPYPLTTAKLI